MLAAFMDVLMAGLLIPLITALSGVEPESGIIYTISNYFSEYGTVDLLKIISVLLLIVVVCKGLGIYISDVTSAKLSIYVRNHFKYRCINQLLFIGMSYLDKTKGSNLYTLASDFTKWTGSLVSAIAEILHKALSVILLLIFLMLISWELTIISFLLILVSSFILRPFINKSALTGEQSNTALLPVNENLLSLIHGMREIRIANKQESFNKLLKEQIVIQSQYSLNNARALSAIQPIFEFGIMSSLSVILISAAVMLPGTSSTWLTTLVAFMMILFRMAPPAMQLNKTRGHIASFIPPVQKVLDFLDRKDKPFIVNANEKHTYFDNKIQFNHVSFSYETKNLVIDDINIEILKGKKIAIVGPSGSGKSTITNLLLRFYLPISGEILIDNINLSDYDINTIRGNIGIVSQETFLFNETIADNIKFTNNNATYEEVKEAAKLANADEFISQLSLGYDTIVGDRGIRLSGGQRQRIAIARALIKKPEILIFDEATSSLDSSAEKIVQNAIDNVAKNHTIITIAHRLSTIYNYDNIYVLSNGKIVEDGTHQELVIMKGVYSNLVNIQSNNAD